MKNLNELVDSLNLIYYEFNQNSNSFIVDRIWTKKYMNKEFIKITYTLSKYNFKFIVKKDKTIKITNKNFLISQLYEFKDYIKNIIKRKKSNIFLLNSKPNPWVKNIPLYKIELISSKVDLNKFDALVFTSKNAVYSINELDEVWKNIPSYVISSNSAKVVETLGGKIEYIGTKKDSLNFANEISQKLKNKRVLYIRAKEVLTDLKMILNHKNIHCEELIVYETKLNEKIKKLNLPQNSIIIFTSPSTIKFFFKSFKWRNDLKAVVIGQSSAKYLPKDIKAYIANNISIEACINKAIEILD